MTTATTAVQQVRAAQHAWQTWRAERHAELSRPHGWLSLTALHWLGPHPSALPGLPGLWWQDGTAVWAGPGGGPGLLTVDGAAVAAPTAVLDADGARTVRYGDLLLEPLHRGEAWGVRVRDPQARTRTAFDGVPTFDYDPAWVVRGRFEPFPSGPRRTAVGSVADGVQHVAELAGEVSFEVAGRVHTLAVGTGQRPLVAFRDATCGQESYPALRFVPVTISGGRATIDFNRATNPPCAFTDFGTCPLPPPGNTLDLPVRAGERWPPVATGGFPARLAED